MAPLLFFCINKVKNVFRYARGRCAFAPFSRSPSANTAYAVRGSARPSPIFLLPLVAKTSHTLERCGEIATLLRHNARRLRLLSCSSQATSHNSRLCGHGPSPSYARLRTTSHSRRALYEIHVFLLGLSPQLWECAGCNLSIMDRGKEPLLKSP